MRVTDTTAQAHALQFQIQQAMTEEQRLLMALEMSLFARELAKERIRQEHPEWRDKQVARELLRLAFLPAPLPARLCAWLESDAKENGADDRT